MPPAVWHAEDKDDVDEDSDDDSDDEGGTMTLRALRGELASVFLQSFVFSFSVAASTWSAQARHSRSTRTSRWRSTKKEDKEEKEDEEGVKEEEDNDDDGQSFSPVCS